MMKDVKRPFSSRDNGSMSNKMFSGSTNQKINKRINGKLKPQWRDKDGSELKKSNLYNLIGNRRVRRRLRKGFILVKIKGNQNTKKVKPYWRKKVVMITEYEDYWDKIDLKRNGNLYASQKVKTTIKHHFFSSFNVKTNLDELFPLKVLNSPSSLLNGSVFGGR